MDLAGTMYPIAVVPESKRSIGSRRRMENMKTFILSIAIGALALPALAGPQKSKQASPDWQIAGWEVTTCCCNDICPCRFNEKPTHMECEGIIAVHIDKGHYGSTKLSDVNFIITGRSFDD